MTVTCRSNNKNVDTRPRHNKLPNVVKRHTIFEKSATNPKCCEISSTFCQQFQLRWLVAKHSSSLISLGKFVPILLQWLVPCWQVLTPWVSFDRDLEPCWYYYHREVMNSNHSQSCQHYHHLHTKPYLVAVMPCSSFVELSGESPCVAEIAVSQMQHTLSLLWQIYSKNKKLWYLCIQGESLRKASLWWWQCHQCIWVLKLHGKRLPCNYSHYHGLEDC